MTPDIEQALDAARVLATAGVPVFCAYPDPERKTPSGRQTGYILPKSWQNTSANPVYVDAWNPGMALCAVMGHILDLVDDDPRNNGGNTDALSKVMPRTYGKAATPSGGTHDFIAALGAGSKDGLFPGVDIKAGDEEGGSRGFAFIAPTIRISKVTGQPAAYQWIIPPDPHQLTNAASDDSGRALAELIRQSRRSRSNATSLFSQPGDIRHAGPIPYGEHHAQLTAYAGQLRLRGIPQHEAEALMLRRLQDCVQPPEATRPQYTEAEVIDLLRDIYSRYAAGDPAAENATSGDTLGIFPPPTDPMAVARQLALSYQADNHATLRYWRGEWMEWQRTRWTETEAIAVEATARRQLEHARYPGADGTLKPWQPNNRKIADVTGALMAITHLASATDPPSWLASDSTVPAAEIVSCANGLLHVTTRKLYNQTPLYFGTTAVPFDYDPAAPEPSRWLQFLTDLWPDDPDSVAALQEFFGYVLSGRTDLHKIMLLIGPTRSGKGTIARILTALIGKGNAAGPTLASLGTNFGLSPLLGKPLAIVSDARLGSGNEHQVVERLLSISGEDMITIDRKYREPWTGKLPSRFLILSNELPRFGDASGAIAGRFIILVMSQTWLGKENTRLTGELLAELPGILSWALNGLDRITDTGLITSPQSSTDAIVALHDLVSPVSAFVRDKCRTGIGEVPVSDLFNAWKEWAETNNHRPGNSATFGRNLRAVLPMLRVAQPREGGVRERHYVGIRLRPTGWNGLPEAEVAACASCGEAMTVVEAGQTTHPMCEPVARVPEQAEIPDVSP